MTRIVDNIQAVKDIDKEIERIDALIDKHARNIAATAAAHRQAVDEWEQRGVDAFSQGQQFDEASPQPPETMRLAQEFLIGLRHDREVAQRERLKRVANSADEVLERAAKQVEKAVEKARPALAVLGACVMEVRSARNDLLTVAQARNATSSLGVNPLPELPALDVGGLAEAIQQDVDLLAAHRPTEPVTERGMTWTGQPPGSGVDPEEDRRLLNRALGKQAQSLRHELPLGYRGGDRLV